MGSVATRRPARIGNAMGAVTDLPENISVLARRDDVDFIVGDWMSEYNMASQGSLKASSLMTPNIDAKSQAAAAFEVNFLESVEPALEDITRNRIKLAVNAGASDTEKMYDSLVQIIARKKLDLKVGWVEGDEVYDALIKCRDQGYKFRNITTGQFLDSWEFDPIYAQCYLGCWGIVEAFCNGADIVVCGRVADAAPTMAAAAFWHGWTRQSYSELAHALVAGHMIECSFYVTGGNFTGFKSMRRSSTTPLLSLPIASIQHDGSFHIGMEDRPDRGGEVSLDTCRAQLLYELQGKRYYNSDVVALVDQIKMEQVAPDLVYVHNIGHEKPPPTTKVGLTAKGGYQAEVHYYLTGLDIAEKAQMLEEQLRYALDTKKLHTLVFTTTGSCAANPTSQDAATVDFRIFAQARSEEALSPRNFLKPCLNMVMQAYPGATFGMEQRAGFAKLYFEYFVTVVPQSVVRHIAHVPAADKDESDMDSDKVAATKSIVINAPTDTVDYLPEQEIEESVNARPLESFGPTATLPLGTIVHARSGDKGSDANVGFFVRSGAHDDEYEWLRSLLSVKHLKTLLQNSYSGTNRIERFELPHIKSVHFLLKDHLDRGVAASSNYDALGKNLAEYLRAKHVQIPITFLAHGKRI
ncbi:uncharacterized protein A1O9_11172 [Exophiala aquamarina CBS 119918]|uniref:DUF1446 domain-containing protein n=1 Tax=Exophiala aquamarina CBS 119918 TaxID=1182545 RepID=A0A072PB16_9EURO|nr:uncharacterized protein A1O9_11172 [Exophiala aquamarina CBS 119918]KEF52755.1 hypothetical protein A1O9_11172 [Exophiala aquamarina CBS 119918]